MFIKYCIPCSVYYRHLPGMVYMLMEMYGSQEVGRAVGQIGLFMPELVTKIITLVKARI